MKIKVVIYTVELSGKYHYVIDIKFNGNGDSMGKKRQLKSVHGYMVS